MKLLAFITLLMPVLTFGQNIDTVEYNVIEIKDSLFYHQGSDMPFTGIVISKSGQELQFKNGKPEGLWTQWH